MERVRRGRRLNPGGGVGGREDSENAEKKRHVPGDKEIWRHLTMVRYKKGGNTKNWGIRIRLKENGKAREIKLGGACLNIKKWKERVLVEGAQWSQP